MNALADFASPPSYAEFDQAVVREVHRMRNSSAELGGGFSGDRLAGESIVDQAVDQVLRLE